MPSEAMKRWAAEYATNAVPVTPAPDTAPPAPSAPPPPLDPERAKRDASMLDGYLRAARMRPPSWSDPAIRPTPGCFCSCCQGRRWWTETVRPSGWRCATCYPPDGKDPATISEVRTDHG